MRALGYKPSPMSTGTASLRAPRPWRARGRAGPAFQGATPARRRSCRRPGSCAAGRAEGEEPALSPREALLAAVGVSLQLCSCSGHSQASGGDGVPAPVPLCHVQLQESGLPSRSVRLAGAGPAGPAAEEEETWEDILEESHDPWMRDPAPPEDLLAWAGLQLSAEEALEAAAPAAAPAAAAHTGSAYERAPLPSMAWREFEQLRGGEPAGAWAVLDVRKQPEEGEQRWAGGPCAGRAARTPAAPDAVCAGDPLQPLQAAPARALALALTALGCLPPAAGLLPGAACRCRWSG